MKYSIKHDNEGWYTSSSSARFPWMKRDGTWTNRLITLEDVRNTSFKTRRELISVLKRSCPDLRKVFTNPRQGPGPEEITDVFEDNSNDRILR